MTTAKSPSLRRVAWACALLIALALSGCGSQAARAPVSAAPQATPATAVSSSPASTAATGAAAPGTADAAGAAMGTSLTVGSASTKPAKGGVPRPSNEAATAATVKYARESEGIGKVTKLAVRGMTRDKKGTWWVLVDITDVTMGANEAVMTFDGKKWDNMVFGEGVSNDDLPPDVRF